MSILSDIMPTDGTTVIEHTTEMHLRRSGRHRIFGSGLYILNSFPAKKEEQNRM